MSRLFALAAVAAIAVTGPARAAVDIVEVESPGGVTAWLVEEHELPFVALEILFRGGTSLDDPDARGAVNLMTGLLEEGAGELDARGFAEARDDLAVSFRFDAGDDTISVSAEFLTDVTDDATALLRTALAEPRFDEDAVERVRAQVLSRLRSDAEDPGEIATETFAAKLYGAHPYATNGRGTIESVTALSRDDLVAAHAGTIARDSVYVGAVGDLAPEQLGVLLDTLFADLPETGAPLPEQVDISLDGGVHVTPYATPQSSILFAQGGIDREHPDFFPAFLLNQVMGAGGFESRLTQEVRVKRGLTYGIYSYLSTKKLAATYQGSVSSANDRISEAIDVVRDEWRDISENGVTAEELEDAKLYLTGAYPLRFDGNGQIAGILVGMQRQNLQSTTFRRATTR